MTRRCPCSRRPMRTALPTSSTRYRPAGPKLLQKSPLSYTHGLACTVHIIFLNGRLLLMTTTRSPSHRLAAYYSRSGASWLRCVDDVLRSGVGGSLADGPSPSFLSSLTQSGSAHLSAFDTTRPAPPVVRRYAPAALRPPAHTTAWRWCAVFCWVRSPVAPADVFGST